MKNGLIYAFITAIVFTTLEPVSKLIANEINPYAITLLRFITGSVILLPFAAAELKKKKIRLAGKDVLTLSALGVLCICCSMVLLQVSVGIADSPALIAVIFSSNSVMTILFAALILKEKITPVKAAAVVLCAAAVIICADFKSGSNIVSVILAFLASLSFSLYTVLSKKFMKKISGIIQTCFSFLAGSIVLLVILLVSGIDITGGVNMSNISILLYLGIVVTGIGYFAYFKALEKGGAMTASLAFFIKPVLTPLAAFFINGIMPKGQVLIAVALIAAGSLLSLKKTDKA